MVDHPASFSGVRSKLKVGAEGGGAKLIKILDIKNKITKYITLQKKKSGEATPPPQPPGSDAYVLNMYATVDAYSVGCFKYVIQWYLLKSTIFSADLLIAQILIVLI